MIKNIVFDMGNVLLDYDPQRFVQRYVENKDTQQLLRNEIFGSVEWLKFDKGLISQQELLENICGALPESIHSTAEQIIETWYEGLLPLTEMDKVIRDLKQEYNIYLLSNAPIIYPKFIDKVPALDQFDGIFISAEWRLVKPFKEIYYAFYQHFGLNPSECYFIDDSAANILAASETGMEGFVYRKNPAHLLTHLNQTIQNKQI